MGVPEPIAEPVGVSQRLRAGFRRRPASRTDRARGAAIGAGHAMGIAALASIAELNFYTATAIVLAVILGWHGARKLRGRRSAQLEPPTGLAMTARSDRSVLRRRDLRDAFGRRVDRL